MSVKNLSQIILAHNMGVVESRDQCDINVIDSFGQMFASPVVLSNMPTNQNETILRKFNTNGWPYVYHRLGGPDDILNFTQLINDEDWNHRSISVGVSKADFELLQKIKSQGLGLDWLTIDVAFIYNKNFEQYIKEVRELFTSVYLIAGNIGNRHGVPWLKTLGVNCVKFGIGKSAVCETKERTGFSSTVDDLIDTCGYTREVTQNIDIMADGGLTIRDEEKGIVDYGDIFKCLNFGAKWVMSSSLFRWCPELADENGDIEQYGNSTARAKGHNKNVEGAIKKFKTNGLTVDDRMREIKDALKSSVSYSGLEKISDAFDSCKYTEVFS